MKKILTVGVFDYFHLGHLRLFKQCKELADYLIVAVQEDDYILQYKPNAKTLYSLDDRVEIINSIAIVDKAITYRNVSEIVKNVEFDIFATGEDQTHEGFVSAQAWCREHGKDVVVLKRTPVISSNMIKSQIEILR